MKITTPNQRRILKAQHSPYYLQIHKGLHLGYRKAPKTKSETWSARFRFGSRYRYQSLGPVAENNDFKAARRAAEQWADDLKAGKGNKLKEQRKAEGLTVGDVLRLYIEEHAKGKNRNVSDWEYQSTRRAKAYVWNRGITGVTLSQLSDEDLKGLQAELRETMTAASVNRNLTGLRAALNWAHLKGWIKDTPWKNVSLLKIAPKTRRKRNKQYFTLKERTAFLDAAEANLRAICTCMLITGCRPSEARRMEVRDVLVDHRTVVLMHRKGNDNDLKEREFQMPESTFKFFRKQVKEKKAEASLFVTPKGLPWSMANLAKAIRATREEHNLSDKWESYCWRHCSIQDWINDGIQAANVAKACGTSIKYIEDNYHAPPKDLPEQLAAPFAAVL